MMKNLLRLIAFITGIFFLNARVAAQDSLNIFPWKVSSKKIGDGVYELTFSTPPVKGWLLYAPSQLSPDIQFTTELQFADEDISLDGKINEVTKAKTFSNSLFGAVKGYDTTAVISAIIRFKDKDSVPALLQGNLLYTYGKEPDFYYPSTTFSYKVEMEGGVQSTVRIHIPSIDINNPVADCGDNIKKDSNLFTIFLLGMFGGLIALFTPCVFPMIPLTVSFFTSKPGEKSRGIGRAALYGFFIFLIYLLLTVPFHIAGKTNPDIFNNISTNVWLNLLFFVIFVVFALSFFGYFEITLPSVVANRTDSRSGIGNIGGIFFMALTLAIVSFSCTGPILGTLLAGVAEQGAWPLTAGAAGFGLALGLPFAVFALFPKWLNSIPRSGGWMTDLKAVLGFIELALAIKFLANADNVKQWGILKREIFVALWVIIGVAIVLYLLGLIKFSHTSPIKKFSKTRIMFLVLFGLATLYLIPGLSNTQWARLNLISGFPPPVCYSVYKNPVNCDKPILDYEEAILLAKKQNKPLLIDFTGWACVNCRRMEENVWTKQRVDKLMKEEFILVSLYVDERTKLPSAQQTVFISKSGAEKSIVTVGDKWTAFQIENFEATSQPQYAIISPDEKALTKTKFYTPDASEFADWLECGLEAFKGKSKK
jgi:thiol:disulfide interchange protein DsbD